MPQLPDVYADLARRYDRMKEDQPARRVFFRELFAKNRVSSVLDCACGTGRDLFLFQDLGLDVHGSDLSAAMLNQAKQKLAVSGRTIPLTQLDFRYLESRYKRRFDAVVCLDNAINELLDDTSVLASLHSMKSVLNAAGILIIDQGQTDSSMANPPLFAPVINDRDMSRIFVMEYNGDIQTVHILDFIHEENLRDVHHTVVKLRIRLRDHWGELLDAAGFPSVEYYGGWDAAPYTISGSRRLIIVARKECADDTV